MEGKIPRNPSATFPPGSPSFLPPLLAVPLELGSSHPFLSAQVVSLFPHPSPASFKRTGGILTLVCRVCLTLHTHMRPLSSKSILLWSLTS